MNTVRQKATPAEKALTGACLLLLLLALLAVMIGTLTRQVSKAAEGRTAFDWSALYPFDEAQEHAAPSAHAAGKLRQLSDFVRQKQQNFEKYHTTMLPGYQKLAELAQLYKRVLRWNYAPYDEYNGVIDLGGGYLSGSVPRVDTREHADAVIALRDFCLAQGQAQFLYVCSPAKLCAIEDAQISETSNFTNANADSLLASLRAAGVDTLDLRERLHSQGLDHHGLFYRTDHHWKTTTGIWAAHELLSLGNRSYGFDADLSLAELSSFDQQLYEKWFLGSQGKKVTLSRAEPEDFVLLFPSYETSFRFTVPTRNVDLTGDYAVTYDMSAVSMIDYYGKNPYAACAYGEEALVTVENLLRPDGKRVLLLRDSMADCVLACLATGVRELHALDLRDFTGSVRQYIRAYQPDLVIVMYGAGSIDGAIDRETHSDKFDFR